jgi:hypothetical protein
LSENRTAALGAFEYTLVEEMLPARFLVDLGIYIQSAAQIELAVWQIIMSIDDDFTSDQQNFHDYLELRKSTPKLVARLKKSAANCRPSLSIRVSNLASRIEGGLVNRNLAAHGAFFSDKQSGKIGVGHYYSEGQKPSKRWYEVSEPISQRQIREAIDDIDSILREAVSLLREAVSLRVEINSGKT